MYKVVSYYRSVSPYPGNARIVQATPTEYILFICHEHVGTVKHMRDTLPNIEKALFSFVPFGHSRPILWKKVQLHGD